MRSRSRLLALILLATLAGCATPPARNLPASNAAIDAFSLDGRVGVKVEQRGYSASVHWSHAGDRDRLRLLSPVGSVVGEIEADGRGARLTTGDKKVYSAGDVQSLTRDVLGWDLPLSGLRYWVTGRPDPASPVQAETRDDRQRLATLQQDDWRIEYAAYFGDSALPSRLTLLFENLSLKLVVDRWDLP